MRSVSSVLYSCGALVQNKCRIRNKQHKLICSHEDIDFSHCRLWIFVMFVSYKMYLQWWLKKQKRKCLKLCIYMQTQSASLVVSNVTTNGTAELMLVTIAADCNVWSFCSPFHDTHD
jgi:predicted Na+-dependent transporter